MLRMSLKGQVSHQCYLFAMKLFSKALLFILLIVGTSAGNNASSKMSSADFHRQRNKLTPLNSSVCELGQLTFHKQNIRDRKVFNSKCHPIRKQNEFDVECTDRLQTSPSNNISFNLVATSNLIVVTEQSHCPPVTLLEIRSNTVKPNTECLSVACAMSRIHFALTLVLCLHYCHGILGTLQNLCVKGQLKCRTDPREAAFVRIKLWDEDTGPNPDDLMADGLSDENGNFELCGQSSDPFGSIDPIFKIYHNCDDADFPCKRKVKLGIPQSYLGGTFEFTDGIDLTVEYPGEERKCFQLGLPQTS